MLIKFIFPFLLCLTTALYADEQLMGGYSTISVTNQAVLEAANFAAQKINQGSLFKIISAQSQVVAGINYSLVLEIQNSAGIAKIYKVVVFVPLPVANLPMQLTSVQELN